MRYLFWIVVFTLASCASSRLARQSTGHNKALPETAGDTAVVKLDTVQHPLDTVKVTVGPIIIDTEVHIPPKDTLTFIGVGDIMMGTNYPNTDRLPPHNARELMKEVSHL